MQVYFIERQNNKPDMLRKDYLLAQIEELAKKFARLIEKKEALAPDVQAETDECYGMLGITARWIMETETEEIISRIGIWELLELLVRIMVEDPRLNTSRSCMQKAQEILFFVQERDRTYSLERVMLEERIEDMLRTL